MAESEAGSDNSLLVSVVPREVCCVYFDSLSRDSGVITCLFTLKLVSHYCASCSE